MTKKYRVDLKEVDYGFIEVEAEDEQEARDKAEEGWHAGEAIMAGDTELHCEDVEELEE